MSAKPTDLGTTARALVTAGKGLLAADESTPTIEKRFAAVGIPCDEESRRAYRDLLFTTAGMNEAISGTILFDETIRQETGSSTPMAEWLASVGIIPGIKVDRGTVELPRFPGEKFTEGLDGLRARLQEYRGFGARFTKWRCVFSVGKDTPTGPCMETNAGGLALFAALSQEAELVPIVEPEVLMDGDHSLARAEAVAMSVLHEVFAALARHRINLEGMLLKTAMVTPGARSPEKAGIEEIAAVTVRCLRRSVPAAVPGVVFLSGGQGDVEATERLNAICRVGPTPWRMTFSFGRALQNDALKTWKGSAAHRAAAQAALAHRARCNGQATLGRYTEAMDRKETAA
ncbi:MAG TPA: class I fructose-bisphosphate aldolase [Candidatus Didemnitutus sp.]|nr:class I fructose-bisphosphate aldolase [Candidatus Didemnitutus sp.]